jgi:hypothetical protein
MKRGTNTPGATGRRFLGHFRSLDRALTAKGFPEVSAWWMSAIERIYQSGRRSAVLRVGRRGGKSSTLSRVAVCEALYGGHVIPPGDIGVVAIVSVNKTEAAERIRLVKAILDALGVKYRPIDAGIELVDRPIAFRVYAATVSGVSGFTSIVAFCDEVSKWRDADTGSNPAREVLASLRPTLAGQPNAKIFLSSSPVGTDDAHARAFASGETDFQTVHFAETWIARPSLTEAECAELEPDEETRAREYGAKPFDGTVSGLMTGAELLACTRRGALTLPPVPGAVYLAAQDPATRSNGWTLAVGRLLDGGRLQVVLAVEWRAVRGTSLDTDEVFGNIGRILRTYGIRELYSDQWSFDALRSPATRAGIELVQSASGAASNLVRFDALRRRVQDASIEFPDDPIVRSDLLGVRKLVSKAGNSMTIELEKSGGRHCDHASSIALMAHVAGQHDAASSAVDPSSAKVAAEIFSAHVRTWDPSSRGGPPDPVPEEYRGNPSAGSAVFHDSGSGGIGGGSMGIGNLFGGRGWQ